MPWHIVDDPVDIALARLSGKVSQNFELEFGWDNTNWPRDILAYSPASGNYYIWDDNHRTGCRWCQGRIENRRKQ